MHLSVRSGGGRCFIRIEGSGKECFSNWPELKTLSVDEWHLTFEKTGENFNGVQSTSTALITFVDSNRPPQYTSVLMKKKTTKEISISDSQHGASVFFSKSLGKFQKRSRDRRREKRAFTDLL